MQKILFIILVLSFCNVNAQQFQYDNTLYKNVYPEDLCKTLKENKGYVLLDVRSPGEYSDTSSSPDFNMGHFKGAKNITINELAQRWRELESVKDKPIFIYCSHSQRSRRASKMLVDSGFTKIYNINGGMTNMIKLRNTLPNCFGDLYESKVNYKILSPAEVAEQSSKKLFYVLDIRPDSVYRSISTYEKLNTLGKFVSANNILTSMIEANLSRIPKNLPILVVDNFGDESPVAASLLANLGYNDISILFNGMNAWLEYTLNEKKKNQMNWLSQTKYKLISADDFNKFAENDHSIVIVDVRPQNQFNNQSKNYWENIGRIKNAVNISIDQIEKNIFQSASTQQTQIILYTFSNQNEVYEAARKLQNIGFQNVSVLYGGIWNMRWSAHNIAGKTHLEKWVVDIPTENQ